MNKTVTINLNGCVFTLDDDAYDALSYYFEALETHFANDEGRKEIIADIEARIAEHFKQNLKVDQQVIGLVEVNRVIEIMGRPDDFDDDESPQPERPSTKTYPKMYRDIDDCYVGGVCSGMGYYLKVDALLVRVVFIVTSFWGGLGAIMYAILWIVVPPAITKAQKLEMRQKPVTAENISKEFDKNK